MNCSQTTKPRLGKVSSMLFYDRISESQGIYANHTGLDTSKECNICHIYFFKDKNFLYQPLVCSGGYDTALRAISLVDFKVISVKGKTYSVVSNELSSLTDKFGSL